MSVVDELERLCALRDSGVLSDPEFEAQKALILAPKQSAESAPQRQRIPVGKIAGSAVAVAFITAVAAAKAGLFVPESIAHSTALVVPHAMTSPTDLVATARSTATQEVARNSAVGSTRDRIGETGNATVENGVPHAAQQSARDQVLQMLSEHPATDAQPSSQGDLYVNARRRLLARGLRPAPIPRGPDSPCGIDAEDEVCRLYPRRSIAQGWAHVRAIAGWHSSMRAAAFTSSALLAGTM